MVLFTHILIHGFTLKTDLVEPKVYLCVGVDTFQFNLSLYSSSHVFLYMLCVSYLTHHQIYFEKELLQIAFSYS